MNIAAQIRKKIKNIPESEPFGYADLDIALADFITAAKAIERLQKKGEIKKVSKGIFYRPEISVFGAMPPKYDLILKNYLFKNGKRAGYITGFKLYNQLSLTTQMAFKTKVATNRPLKKIEISWLKVDAVKAYVEVTDDNYILLGYLDVLKDIKNIPDSSPDNALYILIPKLKKLKSVELNNLIQNAFEYPPRVRALLGAILEIHFSTNKNIEKLKKSINPTTKYKIRLDKNLPNKLNWNIK